MDSIIKIVTQFCRIRGIKDNAMKIVRFFEQLRKNGKLCKIGENHKGLSQQMEHIMNMASLSCVNRGRKNHQREFAKHAFRSEGGGEDWGRVAVSGTVPIRICSGTHK